MNFSLKKPITYLDLDFYSNKFLKEIQNSQETKLRITALKITKNYVIGGFNNQGLISIWDI